MNTPLLTSPTRLKPEHLMDAYGRVIPAECVSKQQLKDILEGYEQDEDAHSLYERLEQIAKLMN